MDAKHFFVELFFGKYYELGTGLGAIAGFAGTTGFEFDELSPALNF